MYNNVIVNVKRKLTEEDLEKFEKQYDITMPTEIKKHYLLFNGGYPENSLFKLNDDRTYIVNYFYSLCCGEGLAIEKVLPLLKDKKIFPDWLVPLANDEGGNLFCYSVRPQEFGSIYFYSHEFEYGDNPERHITYLASGISEFIDSLEYYDEDEDV